MSFQVKMTNLDYEHTRGSDRHSTCNGMPDGMTAMIDRETEHEFLGFRLVQEHTGGGNEHTDSGSDDTTRHFMEGHRGVGPPRSGQG